MGRLLFRAGLTAFVASLTLPWSIAYADQALQSGAAVTLPTIAASSYVPNLYIDVDSSDKQLKIDLNALGGDADLFVRYGTPFPVQDSSASYPTVSYDLINRYSQYHSVSSTSTESILIQPSSKIPLHAGRWYIALLNSSGTSSITSGTLTATLSTSPATAQITIDFANPSTNSDPTLACDDSFWTDTTAAPPIGGNPGTTLGQQRKNALQYAANELASQLQLTVPITVHACGAHLGGDSTSAILAHATPLTFFVDDVDYPVSVLPKKYTWYPGTAAVNLGGTSLCGLAGGPCSGVDSSGTPNNDEIEATFNMDFGNADVLNGEQFYFGYNTTQRPSGEIDFITIAMHEMTHGLGFLGLVNTDPSLGPLGAKAGYTLNSSGSTIDYQNLTEGPYDDIYDDGVASVDSTANTFKSFLGYEVNGSGDADRAAALVSGPVVTSAGTYNPGGVCVGYVGPCTGLRWMDNVAVSSDVNNNVDNSAPNNFPSLYAPCDESKTTTCTTQPSSTLSHTTQTGDMMNAYYSNLDLRNMGLALPMLSPIGWSNAVRTMPTFPTPIPSAWYDQTHSGHGFDFQLAAHDADGDIYTLTFYTYDSDGTPRWYQAVGRLIDGMFLPGPDANGNTLSRIIYQTSASQILGYSVDSSSGGSVVVDFNQAANSPACRNIDRSNAPQLAVMYWSIDGQSGSWCVQPIVTLDQHASPDYNGLWYAPTDSGWGFEVLDLKGSSSSASTVNVLMYLPGADNTPTWATGSGSLSSGTATINLQQITNGFCRTCTPPPTQQGVAVGSLQLSMNPIVSGSAPTGTATVKINYPGGGGFNRSNIPIRMLSTPTGQ